MAADRPRLHAWLTTLATICVVFAVGTVVRDAVERDDQGATGTASAAAGPKTRAAAAVAEPGPAQAKRPGPAGVEVSRAPAKPPSEPRAPRKSVVVVERGEEVAIRDAPRGDIIARQDHRTEFGSATVFAVEKRRSGWLGVPTEKSPNGKLGWVRADPSKLDGRSTEFRIVVDLSRHSARLLKGDELRRKWQVTVGAPESPTPIGTFSVTDLIEGGLHPTYGCCAVAISATQPHLPAGWQGGDRIAFHGTDGPLGVDASNGCVRSTDRDVRALVRTVPLGTPVTIKR